MKSYRYSIGPEKQFACKEKYLRDLQNKNAQSVNKKIFF